MADRSTISFAHSQRHELPEHERAREAPTPLTRAAFERARTVVSVAGDTTRVVAHAAEGPPQPAHVLPDPRPSFAGPGTAELLPSAVLPDRSVTMASEEMKVAFVKARLGDGYAKVSRNRSR